MGQLKSERATENTPMEEIFNPYTKLAILVLFSGNVCWISVKIIFFFKNLLLGIFRIVWKNNVI